MGVASPPVLPRSRAGRKNLLETRGFKNEALYNQKVAIFPVLVLDLRGEINPEYRENFFSDLGHGKRRSNLGRIGSRLYQVVLFEGSPLIEDLAKQAVESLLGTIAPPKASK
jgi:hypothetical protein